MQTSHAEQKHQEAQQQVIELICSEDYKQLAHKNRAWAVPKPTDQEKGEWELLRERLAILEGIMKFWQQVILTSNASYVRKQNSVRKGYKKESAIKSERALLTTIAEYLYSIYKFETEYETPTFGDVMKAAQFKNPNAIIAYFSPKASAKRNAERGNICNFFTKEKWIYFVNLNRRVNTELHSNLKKHNGKTTLILESEVYEPELVQDAMQQLGFNADDVDIKNAQSDSSADGSPTTNKQIST